MLGCLGNNDCRNSKLGTGQGAIFWGAYCANSTSEQGEFSDHQIGDKILMHIHLRLLGLH